MPCSPDEDVEGMVLHSILQPLRITGRDGEDYILCLHGCRHKEGEKGGGKQPPESAVPKTTSGENAGESPTSEEPSALENYNLGHHHYTLDLSAGNVESVRFVKILQGLLLELPFKRLREQFQTVYLLQKHLGVGSARTEKMLSERFGKHSRAYASTPNTQIQRSGFL